MALLHNSVVARGHAARRAFSAACDAWRLVGRLAWPHSLSAFDTRLASPLYSYELSAETTVFSKEIDLASTPIDDGGPEFRHRRRAALAFQAKATLYE